MIKNKENRKVSLEGGEKRKNFLFILFITLETT